MTKFFSAVEPNRPSKPKENDLWFVVDRDGTTNMILEYKNGRWQTLDDDNDKTQSSCDRTPSYGATTSSPMCDCGKFVEADDFLVRGVELFKWAFCINDNTRKEQDNREQIRKLQEQVSALLDAINLTGGRG